MAPGEGAPDGSDVTLGRPERYELFRAAGHTLPSGVRRAPAPPARACRATAPWAGSRPGGGSRGGVGRRRRRTPRRRPCCSAR
ncbi:hypothetical protein ET471_05935 [Xylanimonas protaetiae]|uniref:Uncharacterized protein n=1 Tax=Xylanimonas protaetiae TaxID=2509457 RepID=A0A4P6F2A7_9MICO|nr:hypothetical protein ET471_05935 [Xylanimonas protaetiae]